jgi:hypothetical protein
VPVARGLHPHVTSQIVVVSRGVDELRLAPRAVLVEGRWWRVGRRRRQWRRAQWRARRWRWQWRAGRRRRAVAKRHGRQVWVYECSAEPCALDDPGGSECGRADMTWGSNCGCADSSSQHGRESALLSTGWGTYLQERASRATLHARRAAGCTYKPVRAVVRLSSVGSVELMKVSASSLHRGRGSQATRRRWGGGSEFWRCTTLGSNGAGAYTYRRLGILPSSVGTGPTSSFGPRLRFRATGSLPSSVGIEPARRLSPTFLHWRADHKTVHVWV